MNNTHPLDVAAAVAVASLQALGQLARLVLAHSIALVLTLSGWRPESSADVSSPSSPEPESEPQHCLPVLELRRLARQALGSSATVGGRRIAQARKADLQLALQLSTT